MRGQNVNTSRQFTNFPPQHLARPTYHPKTLIGQNIFFGKDNYLICTDKLFMYSIVVIPKKIVFSSVRLSSLLQSCLLYRKAVICAAGLSSLHEGCLLFLQVWFVIRFFFLRNAIFCTRLSYLQEFSFLYSNVVFSTATLSSDHHCLLYEARLSSIQQGCFCLEMQGYYLIDRCCLHSLSVFCTSGHLLCQNVVLYSEN